MASSSERKAPDFLIIGTQRAGTTSLFKALTQNQNVRAPTRKEIHFFDRFWFLGQRWYRAHFPMTDPDYDWLTGEATADYLYATEAPRRAASIVPHARIITILRNPIQRSYSAWKLMSRKGSEQRTFEDAVSAELGSPIVEPGRSFLPFKALPFAYLSRGHYAEQLERWYTHFPKENILVVLAEELFESSGVAQEVAHFVGVAQIEIPHLHSTSGTPMSPEIAVLLREHFEPYNSRLSELLRRDLPW